MNNKLVLLTTLFAVSLFGGSSIYAMIRSVRNTTNFGLPFIQQSIIDQRILSNTYKFMVLIPGSGTPAISGFLTAHYLKQRLNEHSARLTLTA